jgi:hypothetical protein
MLARGETDASMTHALFWLAGKVRRSVKPMAGPPEQAVCAMTGQVTIRSAAAITRLI